VHLLDAMTEAPAFVRNGRLDMLPPTGSGQLGRDGRPDRRGPRHRPRLIPIYLTSSWVEFAAHFADNST
jgi:hypothetical protein